MNDHRQVRRCDAGQLVAEALAAAGGHHHEAVPPLQRRLHGLALPGAELAEAEVPQQRVRVARTVVRPLRRRLDRDPVEPLQRELRVAVIRGGRPPRLGIRERACGRVRVGACGTVERAPQGPQLFQLGIGRPVPIALDAFGQRQRPGPEVVR